MIKQLKFEHKVNDVKYEQNLRVYIYNSISEQSLQKNRGSTIINEDITRMLDSTIGRSNSSTQNMSALSPKYIVKDFRILNTYSTFCCFACHFIPKDEPRIKKFVGDAVHHKRLAQAL